MWWRRFNGWLEARSELHPVLYGIFVGIFFFAVWMILEILLFHFQGFTVLGAIILSAANGVGQGLAAVKRRNRRQEEQGLVLPDLVGDGRRGQRGR